MARIIWKRRVGQFQSSLNGYLGEVKICGVSPSIIRNDPEGAYRLTFLLPGVDDNWVYGEMGSNNETRLKEIAEELLEKWLKKAGISL